MAVPQYQNYKKNLSIYIRSKNNSLPKNDDGRGD